MLYHAVTYIISVLCNRKSFLEEARCEIVAARVLSHHRGRRGCANAPSPGRQSPQEIPARVLITILDYSNTTRAETSADFLDRSRSLVVGSSVRPESL